MAPRAPRPGATSRVSRVADLSWRLIELAGGWAETSDRLPEAERDRLRGLRTKARNPGTPLGPPERATYASLVVKAVGVERLRSLVDRRPQPLPRPPRETRRVDAAARLKRAARLRDAGVITEEDFANLKARYLEEL